MTTWAPIWKIRSIVSFTERSLPGIGVAEKITVSPEWSSTSGWSRCAIRRSAESGSPWLPVEITTTFSSGKSSISFGWIKSPSGALAMPRLEAMLKFLRIERPTSATRRSSWAAASITCWTRWTFEAKQVTMIRPSQREKTSSRAGPTLDSDGRDPGPVGVGRVAAEAEQALAAELGEPRDVRRDPVDRGLVELVVAGDAAPCRARWSSATARASGIECDMWTSSMLEGPGLDVLARRAAPRSGTSRSLCSSSLERTMPIVSRPP